ncbi:helix-turn-helix transcriptional regulator [Pseudomonas gingeri]|uniref:winged helix-turn-helix transcriptional regulator n=1 Tax=Pseudomonas gingeri TaxID=117681 RepID=UPI0015A10E86|nr:helix-turn-helix transcriptional regulator [Pseudomonas gingeri]NWE67804.1 helix-turn-helix transcriptional regulator [Pseudomonas gingeri]
MKRKSLEDSPCAIARALDTIGDWWTLLILRDAFEGSTRFNEFQKSLSIPKNILSIRLKALVAREILEAVPAPDGGNYQEYVLTALGRDLFHVMVALRQWGERNLFAEGEGPVATLVDRVRGRPVAPLQLHSDDGRPLELADTLVAYSK